MPLAVDTISYNKRRAYPIIGHGYSLRTHPPTSIVVHTTNNKSVTSAEHELDFLYRSAKVSAHFLVTKGGAIYQFLDPRSIAAWHAGEALAAFVNQRSIGIELHVSLGEQPTQRQKEALAELLRFLMAEFGIPLPMAETHRYIAPTRKSDPEGWSDVDFYAFRARLVSRSRRFLVPCVALTSNDLRIAGIAPSAAAPHTWQAGAVVTVDDETSGIGHDASGVGFFPLAYTEVV